MTGRCSNGSVALGRYQDVCVDWRCDTVITDPPYGKKTHDSAPRRGDRATRDDYHRGVIDTAPSDGLRPSYDHWSALDVVEFVDFWHPRTSGWIVALTSHDLIPVWQEAYERTGRYAFAPVACVVLGMTVRLGGDGPSSWTLYAMVSRPRTRVAASWRTLPGAYVGTRSTDSMQGRGKPQWLMRALVADYSNPEDEIVDPCAGYGATISAALGQGRNARGVDCDPEAVKEANQRIRLGVDADAVQTNLFT